MARIEPGNAQYDLLVMAGDPEVYVCGRHSSIRGVYLARGHSRHLRERWLRIQGELRAGGLQRNPGKAKILATRREVVAGYQGAAEMFLRAGQDDLAQRILGFIERMGPPRTTDEHLVAAVARRSREPRKVPPWEYLR